MIVCIIEYSVRPGTLSPTSGTIAVGRSHRQHGPSKLTSPKLEAARLSRRLQKWHENGQLSTRSVRRSQTRPHA